MIRPDAAAAPLVTQAGGGNPPYEPAHLSVQTLMREGHKVASDLGMSVSVRKMSRLIRRFIQDGRSDIDLRSWFIAYVDPTGETAVRGVMKELMTGAGGVW